MIELCPRWCASSWSKRLAPVASLSTTTRDRRRDHESITTNCPGRDRESPGTAANGKPGQRNRCMSDTKSQPSAQEFTRQVFEFLYGVMRDHELPPSAETIAVCLTRYFSRKHGGAAWPALETIAKDTGVNKSTAQRTLLRMGKRGHLHIEPGKQGRGHSSKYWMASGQEKLHQRNFKAEEKLQTAELKVAFEGSKSCTHATEPSYNHFNEPRERAPRARAALSDDWKPSEESMAEVERYFKRWAPEIDQIRRELINYSKPLKRPLPDPDATIRSMDRQKSGRAWPAQTEHAG
jgi:Helix-turn-helix domain